MIRILIIIILFFTSSYHLYAGKKETIDSLHLVLNTSKGVTRVNVLNQLSELYQNIDLKKSGHLARVAIDVAKDYGSNEGVAMAYENLAAFHDKSNHKDSAVFGYLLALDYYEHTNKLEETATVYNSLGVALMEVGRYSDALDNLVKGLVIREQLKSKEKIGDSYLSMGTVMMQLHEPQQALEHYLKSYEHLKIGNSSAKIATVLTKLGVVNHELKNYQKCDEYYGAALSILLKNKNQYGVMNVYTLLGDLMMEINDLNTAITHYNRSLKIANELNNVNYVAKVYINLGNLYGNKMGMLTKGKEYLEKGLSLSLDIQNKELENTAYKALAGIYFAKNEFKQAYLFEKKHTDLNSELLIENTKIQIQKSKAVLQMQLNRINEISIKIAKADRSSITSANRMLIVVSCSGVIILVLLFLYLKEKKHL